MKETAIMIGLAMSIAGCASEPIDETAGTRAELSAEPTATLRGEFVETDSVELTRRPHGSGSLIVTESTLEFSGSLTGRARARTTRLEDARGESTLFRAIHLTGYMGRTPVDWHLVAAGPAAGGDLFIAHDTQPSPAATASGTFVDAGRGETVYELPMFEMLVEMELSGQNDWSASAPLWVSVAAPGAFGGDPETVLAPVIRAKHSYPTPVTINHTEVEYYVENGVSEETWEQDAEVEPEWWKLASIDTRDDNFVSPLPGPWAFVARVFVDGSTEPLIYANVAQVFEGGAPGGSPWPVGLGDIPTGAYFASFTGHVGHDQRYGHDIWVRRWTGTMWSQLRSGMDESSPQNYLIWGQPVYAIEDGTVTHCVDDQLDNPDTSVKDPQLDGSTNDPGGNHYIIERPSGVVDLYAHMAEGSVDCQALGVGDTVFAGDLLGNVGNTGTGAPHLHIHAELNNAPVPYYFSGVRGIDQDDFSPPASPAPWVYLDSRAVPVLTAPEMTLLDLH